MKLEGQYNWLNGQRNKPVYIGINYAGKPQRAGEPYGGLPEHTPPGSPTVLGKPVPVAPKLDSRRRVMSAVGTSAAATSHLKERWAQNRPKMMAIVAKATEARRRKKAERDARKAAALERAGRAGMKAKKAMDV